MTDTDRYDDIINYPHWHPKNHARMPMASRAAQFAPFAALVGHDEAIRETARLTDSMCELDAELARTLNEKINLLIAHLALQPTIEVTYFEDDGKKEGGMYCVYQGPLRKIDESEQALVFADGTILSMSSIRDIRGSILSEIDDRM